MRKKSQKHHSGIVTFGDDEIDDEMVKRMSESKRMSIKVMMCMSINESSCITVSMGIRV